MELSYTATCPSFLILAVLCAPIVGLTEVDVHRQMVLAGNRRNDQRDNSL